MNTEYFQIMGKELAEGIFEQFGTRSILQLCQIAKINIRYEKWNPTTLGEFDRKNNTICLNLNAALPPYQILAHEIGHYFIHQKNIQLSRAEEEIVASTFAEYFQE